MEDGRKIYMSTYREYNEAETDKYAPSTLYLVRHAQQNPNAQMEDNAQLTQLGIIQAQTFGEYLVSKDFLPRLKQGREIRVNFTASKRPRTLHTAKLVLGHIVDSVIKGYILEDKLSFNGISANAQNKIKAAIKAESLQDFNLDDEDISQSRFLTPDNTIDRFSQGESGSYPAYSRWYSNSERYNQKHEHVRTRGHLKHTVERYFGLVKNKSKQRVGNYDEVILDFTHETHIGAFDAEKAPRQLEHVSFVKLHSDGPDSPTKITFDNASYRTQNVYEYSKRANSEN